MSWEATAYVKELVACPDGARLSRGQKLLLFVLADYHNTKYRAAWPSEPLLAREALASLSQAKRDLTYLEQHLVVRKLRPQRIGRGIVCAYEFRALDAKDQLSLDLSREKKRVQDEPLFSLQKNSPEGVHPQQESSPEGVQKGSTESIAIRKNEEPEPKPNQEHHAFGALRIWLDTKARLQKMLPADEYKLWVEPAMLTCVMSDSQLLVALPPNGRIVEAARAREGMLRRILHDGLGFGVSFTSYPDAYQMERLRKEHPDFYAQFSPAMRRTHEDKYLEASA
ncbi:MAG: hypothetical protein ACRD20_18265 [Terriglobales bacterium]